MSSSLEEVKNQYYEKLKKVALVKAGVDVQEVDKYVKFISETNEEEINKEAQIIVGDMNREPVGIDVNTDKTWRLFD